MSKIIKTTDRDPCDGLEAMLIDPSAAQLQLMHAQAQRDQGDISAKEMAIVERVAGPMAREAKTIYNPFTGEIRKVYLINAMKGT